MPDLQVCEPEVDEESRLEHDLKNTEAGVGIECCTGRHVGDWINFIEIDILIPKKQEIESEGREEGDVIEKGRIFVDER